MHVKGGWGGSWSDEDDCGGGVEFPVMSDDKSDIAGKIERGVAT